MGQGTLLFIDEIHRFNRAQQDGFLPYVEDGTVILVGATTENPSFELNAALLSRCQVLVLKRFDEPAMEACWGGPRPRPAGRLPLDADARGALIAMADGDGRYLLNLAEELFALPRGGETLDTARWSPGGAEARAALRQGAGQPLQPDLARCTSRCAAPTRTRRSTGWRACWPAARTRFMSPAWCAWRSEDIGLADPQALLVALAAWQAYERLGSPGGRAGPGPGVLYLATAPKSNAAYKAFKAASAAARKPAR